MLRWLSRVYALMLLAYPADFRREYGQEMTTAFRTRARDIERRQGPASLVPFMAHVVLDWMRSTAMENTNAPRMDTLRWIAALPLAWLAAFAALSGTGMVMRFLPLHGFRYFWIAIGATIFFAAALFVTVGVGVAPGRKDAVARVASGVVVAIGAGFILGGAIVRESELAWWGSCALLGAAAAYLPRRATLNA